MYCSKTSRIPIPIRISTLSENTIYESHTILAQGDISDICFMLLFSFLPTSVFKVYSSSAASVSHSVVIIPLTEDLACLLCCFSIHSSHRPVCIRSLCIRASASDTSVESRLTRFAMVNSHHRYLAEFTGHIVDVLVCTLNLCLLWTWLLRIRLCRKTRLVFNAFGPFVSTQSVALLLSRMSIMAEAAFNYFRIWGVLHSIDQIEHHCDQAVELGPIIPTIRTE